MKTIKKLPCRFCLNLAFDYNPETGEMRWSKYRERRPGKIVGHICRKKHRRVLMDGTFYFVHRIAWKMHYGYDPDIIDHINRNPTDNRICNLRSVTNGVNVMNAKVLKTNKSKIRGVQLRLKKTPRWRARITKHGSTIIIGTFDCPLMAGLAYQRERDAYIKEVA